MFWRIKYRNAKKYLNYKDTAGNRMIDDVKNTKYVNYPLNGGLLSTFYFEVVL